MSVAQKDGIDQRSFTDRITYEDLYQRWEEGNWRAYEIDFSEDRKGWEGTERDPAALGALDLLDVLLRRGLGHRQPLSLHRRRPEGGAEVLPRHPAGGRGPALRLLPSLLQGRDRRRRLDRLHARLHRGPARLGIPERLRPPRPDGRGAPPRPIPAQVRAGHRPVPHGRRGDPGPAGPALHRGLLHQGRDDAGVQRRHAQRLARRAATHRLRRQDAGRLLPRVG